MPFLSQTDIRIEALQSPLDPQFDVWNTSSAAPLNFTFRFGSFDNQGWGFSNWTGLNTSEQTAMRSVMAEYASVANVKFTEVADGAQADFDFGHVDLGWTGGQGGFNYNWSSNNGVTTFDSEHYAVFSNGLDLSAASNRNLLLHEFGHAMTLKHPGNYDIGGGTPDGPFLPEDQDSNLNTVMSYHENPNNGQFSDHLMPYDIAALQARFGANMTFHTGSDVYTGPDGNVQTIWDAGGKDRIDAGAYTSSVVIDLREGAFSSLGAKQNLAIAYGCVIEDASGGAGADRLIGNAANNRLDGRAGADTMIGGKGDDTYIVGNSRDVVIELADQGTDRVLTTVSYTLGAGQSIQELGTRNSTLTSDLRLTGNELAQTIRGNAGDNVIDGNGGRDTLWGGKGKDTFVFDTKLSASTNVDKILDFSVADDTIRLDHDVFTSLKVGALSAGAFEIGTHATEANDRIIYNKSTGALLYDSNGSAAGGTIQFATLQTGLHLTHNDFMVV